MESKNTRSRRASLGRGLAAVGAILSFIFVGLEIRQNTTAMRGSTYQAVSEANAAWLTLLLTNADLRTLVRRFGAGDTTLTAEEWSKARLLQLLWWRSVENAHYQFALGNLPEESFRRWINPEAWSNPNMQKWWLESRRLFTPAFVRYVEQATGVSQQ